MTAAPGQHPTCHDLNERPLVGTAIFTVNGKNGRKAVRPVVTEAVWKETSLVVFGIELEIAGGEVC